MADDRSRTGIRYASAEVLMYVDSLHAPHDAALHAAFEAPHTLGLPPISVSQSEGKLLGMLLSLSGARKVVEVGTLAGYSAIRIARALSSDGHLWTLESEAKHHAIAGERVRDAGLEDRVTCLLGPALEQLEALATAHGPFDAVFIDADKGNYDLYGRWAAQHVRRGGLLLGDNAYFFGRLLEDSPPAAAMRRFHEEAAQSFDTVCLPTPDGLLLGIKR